MGIAGPKPKDAATRALGPKSHHKQKNTGFDIVPMTELDFPEELAQNMPEPVLKRARESFALLVSRRVMGACDIESFARYVHHLRLVHEANEIIKREGLISVDNRGVKHKHPILQIHRDNSMMALRFEEQFGLTPSARSRVSGMETEKEGGEYAEFRK